MVQDLDMNRAGLKLLQAIGKTSNLVGTDLTDVEAARVTDENGPGVRMSFTVSSNALGKADAAAWRALGELLPDEEGPF